MDNEEVKRAIDRALDVSKVLYENYGSIIDKKIVAIRPLVKEELDQLYWSNSSTEIPFAIILEDDQVLVPSSDSEGNGPGFLILAGLMSGKDYDSKI